MKSSLWAATDSHKVEGVEGAKRNDPGLLVLDASRRRKPKGGSSMSSPESRRSRPLNEPTPEAASSDREMMRGLYVLMVYMYIYIYLYVLLLFFEYIFYVYMYIHTYIVHTYIYTENIRVYITHISPCSSRFRL